MVAVVCVCGVVKVMHGVTRVACGETGMLYVDEVVCNVVMVVCGSSSVWCSGNHIPDVITLQL